MRRRVDRSGREALAVVNHGHSYEEAVRRWRNLEENRRAQTAGRQSLFANYRLRIAQVIRDYGMNERAEAPEDSRKVHS